MYYCTCNMYTTLYRVYGDLHAPLHRDLHAPVHVDMYVILMNEINYFMNEGMKTWQPVVDDNLHNKRDHIEK